MRIASQSALHPKRRKKSMNYTRVIVLKVKFLSVPSNAKRILANLRLNIVPVSPISLQDKTNSAICLLNLIDFAR
jgi:hypothetical protein